MQPIDNVWSRFPRVVRDLSQACGTEELAQIVESVWQTLIDKPIRYLPQAEAGARPPPSQVTASIRFSGAWPGLLTTTCRHALARSIAARLFQVPVESSSAEDVRDALAEVVNILGGNVNAVLPGPCQLSLPSVLHGECEVAPSGDGPGETVDAVRFACEGEALLLRLVRCDVGP